MRDRRQCPIGQMAAAGGARTHPCRARRRHRTIDRCTALPGASFLYFGRTDDLNTRVTALLSMATGQVGPPEIRDEAVFSSTFQLLRLPQKLRRFSRMFNGRSEHCRNARFSICISAGDDTYLCRVTGLAKWSAHPAHMPSEPSSARALPSRNKRRISFGFPHYREGRQYHRSRFARCVL
jgi:hypothetical protein